jgi:hypothetical protein
MQEKKCRQNMAYAAAPVRVKPTAQFRIRSDMDRLDPTGAPVQQIWHNQTNHRPTTAKRMDAFPANTHPNGA